MNQTQIIENQLKQTFQDRDYPLTGLQVTQVMNKFGYRLKDDKVGSNDFLIFPIGATYAVGRGAYPQNNTEFAKIITRAQDIEKQILYQLAQ